MEEIWKDITGYEGLYEVSNMGRVRSKDRLVKYQNGREAIHKGKEIVPTLKKSGYYQVSLNKDNNRRSFRLHRLVAFEFVTNTDPQKFDIVNHIDGNKTNNRYDNLEWTDNSGNMRHAYDNNLIVLSEEHKQNLINNCKKHNEEISKKVAKIDVNTGEILEVYDSLADAASKNNIKSASNLSACIRGKYKSSHGFIWKEI